MLKFNHMLEVAAAALGAFLLTLTSVGAAVGPARFAETEPVQIEAALAKDVVNV